MIFPFSLKEREIEMKKRVYTLYRVSTKGQVEKDDIPMQKEACRNFAESQGWEIVKEFSEKGVSGFKKSAKDRDELQKIQQAAMEGKFDILLVFMFDRLGRRDDETPFIVEWFTKQGIEVWSVNEGQQRFDTHVDKLMNYIRYWQASGESLKTSVRTRTRLEQLTGEGHYTGGTVAFGYKRVRLGRVNKKNQEVCDLVIDEAEAEIVRLIFHKYVYEGYGAQKLSHYLYEQGVVGRNNKNIPNTSIVRIIKNKGYTGYLINGAVETECPQLRIIEPELFEQAQELRQARTCERGGTSLGTSSKALLTGLVYCGHCGNRLSLTSSGRTHTYADGQSGYGVSKLDSIVEEVVRQIFAQFREVSRKKLLESVKNNDAARIQKKIKKIQKDLEAKQKELDDLKAETILVIRGVSALDKELLGTLVAEAKDALETLEKQLVQAQEEYEEATKTAKRSNYILEYPAAVKKLSQGEKTTKTTPADNTLQRMVDREAKRAEGKGVGYDRWAAKHNLKQMAATVTAYQQYGFSSPEELDEACSAAYTAMRESLTELKQMEKTLNGKKELQRQVLAYSKTRPVRDGLKQQKNAKAKAAYRQKHESDFIIADAAARYFRENGISKLPSYKALQAEIETLIKEKNSGYNDYRAKREEYRRLQTVKGNIDQILRRERKPVKRQEQER